ncbi:hypothetical protein ACQY0O_006233 [Thecaphora frezii]
MAMTQPTMAAAESKPQWDLPMPAAIQQPGGGDDGVIVISDDSDDEAATMSRPSGRPSARRFTARKSGSVARDDDDNEVQFIASRSRFRQASPLGSIWIQDSPPRAPVQLAPAEPGPSQPPTLKRPRNTFASLAAKRAKTEPKPPLQPPPSPQFHFQPNLQPRSQPENKPGSQPKLQSPLSEWARFMTFEAHVQIQYNSPAVAAGDELLFNRGVGSKFFVTVHDKNSELIGYLDKGVAADLAQHLAAGSVRVEAYALEPVHCVEGTDSLARNRVARISKTPRIRICMDLKCSAGSERAWFQRLKPTFKDAGSLDNLPAQAFAQGALARDLSARTAAPSSVGDAPTQQDNVMGRIQIHLNNVLAATRAAALPAVHRFAGSWWDSPDVGGSSPVTDLMSTTSTHHEHPHDFAMPPYGQGWTDWEAMNPLQPPIDQNDDDDDDDGAGTGNLAISSEQDEIMRGLAGSSYQGRNALSALYDEDTSLDVATLPLYPYLDSIMANGLKTELKYHQSQGLAWMIRKEHPVLPRRKAHGLVMLWRAVNRKDGSSRYNHMMLPGLWQREPPINIPRGGILSDEMGLGKTLQILALCLSDPTGQKLLSADAKKREKEERAWRRKRDMAKKGKGKKKATEPDEGETETETEDEAANAVEATIDPLNESYIKTTLIICPLSVIYNWVSQIQQHTDNAKVKFAVYHGDNIKKIGSRWSQYDFLITTYDTIKSEFKPIDQIRRAREQAEQRRDLIINLEHRIEVATLNRMYDVERDRQELARVKQQQEEELASWVAKRPLPSSLKLKDAFARAQAKSKGKGKGRRIHDSDSETETDFQWSPTASDGESDAKPAKASRKSSGKAASTTTTPKGKASKTKAKRVVTSNGNVEYDFDELFTYELPKLLKTKYRRLVLDEAHVGRNSKTLLHRALLEVSAERVWCVTGTPLINSTKDLQSLCSYLRVEHLEDPKMWSRYIERAIKNIDNPAGARLLRNIIFCTTLRRTKDMKGPDHTPLIELPPIIMYKHNIELDPQTREFYDQVATVMRSRVLGLWREGELANQYSNVLLFLCRLRQICCSRDLVPPNLLEEIQELLAAGENAEHMAPVAELDAKTIKTLQEKLRATITTGSLEECPICLEAFKDARITPCSHVFCYHCIQAVITTQAKCPLDRFPLPPGTPLVAMPTEEQIRDFKDDEAEDEVDPRTVKEDTPSVLDDDGGARRPTGDEGDETVQSAKIDQLVEILRMTERASTSSTQPMIKSLVFSNFVSFLNRVADRLDREGIPYCRFVGSMNKVKRAKVLQSFDRPIWPGTQSNKPRHGGGDHGVSEKKKPRSLLDMLDQQISRHKGADTDESKDETFRHASSSRQPGLGSRGAPRGRQQGSTGIIDDRIPLVMLISIQAGAVGLNLTAASQVFILDPWWQGQIEAQAIDRVHRIGQIRPVKVFQFVCNNTVEQRVLEIQAEKEELIKNSFSGIKNNGESISRQETKKESTIRDILRIFGITGANGEVLEEGGGGGSGRSAEAATGASRR